MASARPCGRTVDGHELGEVEHVDLLKLAAPNSGVITYSGTSTSGTMAASPWPMPEVSTMQIKARALGGHRVGRQLRLPISKRAEVAGGERRMPMGVTALPGPDTRGIHADAVAQSAPPPCAEGSMEMTPRAGGRPGPGAGGGSASSVSDDLPGAAGAGDAQHRYLL